MVSSWTASRTARTATDGCPRYPRGYLDEAEQKMRELDTSNRGFLSNEKVYEMLGEQMKLQKKMVTQRWLIVGLCVFAVILALANMGTAFAAASLAKDTSVDTSTHNMMTKDGSDLVGTKPVAGTQIQLNGENKKCLSISTISEAYRNVANGSPIAVIDKKTDGSETARTVTEASSTDDRICFGASGDHPVCFDLSSDSCVKDQDGNARRLSKKDRELRARHLSESFRELVEGGPSLRRLQVDCGVCEGRYNAGQNNPCNQGCAHCDHCNTATGVPPLLCADGEFCSSDGESCLNDCGTGSCTCVGSTYTCADRTC